MVPSGFQGTLRTVNRTRCILFTNGHLDYLNAECAPKDKYFASGTCITFKSGFFAEVEKFFAIGTKCY